jgi:DNA topoisomerase III
MPILKKSYNLSMKNMKKMIITEKPSVAKSFALALGVKRVAFNEGYYYENDKYVIGFCFGHMLRLKNPNEISNEYTTWKANYIHPDNFDKVMIEDSATQTTLLITLMQRENIYEIIIATDAGREGENIAREIIDYAFTGKNRNFRLKRFWTSDVLSERVILQTMETLYDANVFDGLYDAAKGRERSDWLIGFNATRAFTSLYSKGSGTLSIGRVQTPVLSLIVEREDEILHFKEREFYNVVATSSSVEAKALLKDMQGDRFAFNEKIIATNLIEKCKPNLFLVSELSTKIKNSYPAKLFSIPTLQQSANKTFGYSPDLTLKIAQSLYEKRFITYPRTDSEVLGNEEKDDTKIQKRALGVSEIITDSQEKIMLMRNVEDVGLRVFNPKKLTDHHAILPAYQEEWSGKVSSLTLDEANLFKLISTRFVDAFLPAMQSSESEAVLENDNEKFIAKAKEIIDLGYEQFNENRSKSSTLNLIKGEKISLNLSLVSLTTTSPKRYTQGEMIGVMSRAHRYIDSDDKALTEALKEADGLGTGATRDKFLPLLEKRGFIEIKNNIIFPLTRGIELIELLCNSPITNPVISALMELELKKIEQNKSEIGLEGFIKKSSLMAKELINYAIKNQLHQSFSHTKNSDIKKEIKSLGKCPACEHGQVVQTTQAYGCSEYKSGCKFTIWFNSLSMMGHKVIKESEIKKLLKGKTELKLKHKDGRVFEAECTLEEQNKKWRVKVNFDQQWKAEKLGICPLCQEDLVESPKAYGCSKWREGCRFKVFKDALGRFGGRKIAKTNFKKLISSGSFITKLKRKNGEEYEASILLDLEYGVKVDFSNGK